MTNREKRLELTREFTSFKDDFIMNIFKLANEYSKGQDKFAEDMKKLKKEDSGMIVPPTLDKPGKI